MDEMRFRSQQSPRNESPMNAFVSPPRSNGTRLPQPVPSHDPRSTLPRRFTTDSGRVPTLSTINNQQRGPEPQDLSGQTSAMHKVQLLEKKRVEYERIREQKRRFEVEMQKLEMQQRREEQELASLHDDLIKSGTNNLTGHQSEPTTPPEYRETSSGFPTMFSRPNRYSTSSLTSPPGLYNRPGRSGSQLASPQGGIMHTRFAGDDQLPTRSVPGSRRNSEEDEKEEAVRQDPTSHRSTNALNRYSMPVTRSRNGLYDHLDQNNTTRFLFADDDTQGNEAKMYQDTNVDEDFPTLTRREGQPNMLSASSAALDLAQSPSGQTENITPLNGWGSVGRHRSQQSMSTVASTQLNGTGSAVSAQPSTVTDVTSIGHMPTNVRHSFEAPSYSHDKAADMPPAAQIMASPPKLQQSFSANDVPTVKNSAGAYGLANANNHAQQYLHNHNASLGRIPAGAMPNRHSRELSIDNNNTGVVRENVPAYASIGSALQGNASGLQPGATPFGPTMHQGPGPSTVSSNPSSVASPVSSNQGTYNMGYYNGGHYNMPPNNGPTHAYGAGLPLLSQNLQQMSMGAPSAYPAQNFTGYGALYGGPAPVRDSQARVIQNRRQMDNEAMNRYNNMPLEQAGGQIYEFCKDQHGCRYLQKQLENRVPEHVHMIWLETNQHVVELMTDPFGNYLCQKLLEYCNDDERTVLIQNAAADMVRIALNQHGTRALQKMIEFVSTDGQVALIIDALRHRVVELIQDLNGNHVIQKCLNKLSAADAQFIFDAVGGACVDVGTHRHGCCVLQRCIDHASGDQKIWLIERITDHAVTLVQDPFGNYVVQYIIDLNESGFTEPLVARFRGRICQLSRHKFSSNVIEKCLRCSLDPSKDMIVDELLTPGEMERLLRDSFANYVIQTALEYATSYMKHRMVETIRPILPQIRTTPYGRRIQAKVQAYDSRSGQSSGQMTPADSTQGQIPLRVTHNRTMSSNNTSILSPGGPFAGVANGMPAGLGARNAQPAFPPPAVLTVPPPQPVHVQPAPAAPAPAPRPVGHYGAPPTAYAPRVGLPPSASAPGGMGALSPPAPGLGGIGNMGSPDAGASLRGHMDDNETPTWL